jgi:hypothetical protein
MSQSKPHPLLFKNLTVVPVAGHTVLNVVPETAPGGSKLAHLGEIVREGGEDLVSNGGTFGATTGWLKKQCPSFSIDQKTSSLDELLVVYTDLEPDDLFAIATLRAARVSRLASNPIVIFVADVKNKDRDGIFAKKLVMAATALGAEFVQDLIVVAPVGSNPPKTYRTSEIAMADAVKRILKSGDCQKVTNIAWVFIAPGQGNVKLLVDSLLADPRHVNLVSKSSISIYSGAFNTRSPNSTQGDIEALQKFVRRTTRPITDLAHFHFTGGPDVNPSFASLAALYPEIGQDVTLANPFFGEAWAQFCHEFDSRLIEPEHPNLFRYPLDDEEKYLFSSTREQFEKGDVRGYCQAMLSASYVGKIAGYKLNTVRSIAGGTRDGPLCDYLLYIHEWLQLTKPQLLKAEYGNWSVDAGTGHTRIIPPCPGEVVTTCSAYIPHLLPVTDQDTLDEVKKQTKRSILTSIGLSKESLCDIHTPS